MGPRAVGAAGGASGVDDSVGAGPSGDRVDTGVLVSPPPVEGSLELEQANPKQRDEAPMEEVSSRE